MDDILYQKVIRIKRNNDTFYVGFQWHHECVTWLLINEFLTIGDSEIYKRLFTSETAAIFKVDADNLNVEWSRRSNDGNSNISFRETEIKSEHEGTEFLRR